MPPWLNLLKPVIHELGEVISKIMLHRFTKPKAISSSQSEPAVTQKQIQELQAASESNAGAIKVVAQQLENTVTAIETGAKSAESSLLSLQQQLKAIRKLAIASIAVAILALVVAVVLWFRH